MRKNSNPNRGFFAGAGSAWVSCALAVLVLASSGCDDDIVPEPEGVRIRGQVFLDGEFPSDYETPTLQIGAFVQFPPNGPPAGFTVIPFPDFTAGGVEYEIFGMPEFDRYQVVAQVNDQANPDVTGGPAGAFPNFCQLNAVEGGVVTVTEDEPTVDIDITMYSGAGTTDPCFVPTGECPEQSGRGSLVVDIASMVDPASFTDADNLFLAVFPASNFPGAPSGFTVVPRADLEFPVRPILNNLAPDDYVVFACYDNGGNNLMNCQDGVDPNDVFAYYDNENPVTVSADSITTIGLDIDDGSSVPAVLETAGDAGCPPLD